MRGDGVKRFRKPLCIGLLLGALELGAAGLLAGVGRLASFTDVAFGLGVATLLFGLLLLLGGRHRVQAGMGTVNLFSPTASTAFQAQVSYDEAKTAKMPAQPLDCFEKSAEKGPASLGRPGSFVVLRFLWQGGEGELLEGALGGALGEHAVEAAGEGADGHLGGEQLGAAGAHLGERLVRRPGVEGVAQPGGVDAQLDGLAFGQGHRGGLHHHVHHAAAEHGAELALPAGDEQIIVVLGHVEHGEAQAGALCQVTSTWEQNSPWRTPTKVGEAQSSKVAAAPRRVRPLPRE